VASPATTPTPADRRHNHSIHFSTKRRRRNDFTEHSLFITLDNSHIFTAIIFFQKQNTESVHIVRISKYHQCLKARMLTAVFKLQTSLTYVYILFIAIYRRNMVRSKFVSACTVRGRSIAIKLAQIWNKTRIRICYCKNSLPVPIAYNFAENELTTSTSTFV